MKPNLFSIPRLFLIYVLCFQMACSNSISGTFFSSVLPTSPVNFGVNGIVTTNFLTDLPTDDFALAMAIQADGKVVVAGHTVTYKGSDFSLSRFNSDGSIDTTFNGAGTVLTNVITFSEDFGNGIAIQSDGKILVTGVSDTASGPSGFALIRYNSDGRLDTTFNGTGIVITDLGSSIIAGGSLIQSDGKILVSGSRFDAASRDFTLVRFNADGSLDSTFGSSGKVTTDIGSGSWDHAYALAIQSDGKIVAAGYSDSSGNVLVRYNADGSLDTTFNGTGKVLTGITLRALAIQANGKILAAGFSSLNFAVARFNADGSPDTTFNGTGAVTTDIGTATNDYLYALALQSDGKIVATGHSQDPDSNFAIVRYNVNGSLDTTFNSTGKVTTDIGAGSIDVANTLSIQADGKIIAVGESNSSGTKDFTLVRYNTDGSLDTTFGSTGKAFAGFKDPTNDYVFTMAAQSDGKIITGGYTVIGGYRDFALVRHNADGSLDSTFGSTGKVITDFGGLDDQISALAIQADGKIIAAGSSVQPGIYDFALVRYNLDGSLDTTFGGTGKVTSDFGSGDSEFASAIAVYPDGRIVLAGWISPRFGSGSDIALVRYNPDGSLDTTLGGTGKITTHFGAAPSDRAHAVAVQPDGKIVVAGVAVDSLAIVEIDFILLRYNVDGTLDTTFNGTGKVVTEIGSAVANGATAIAIQADGKIVATGFSSDDIALVRYNFDGSLDTSFNGAGIVTADISNSSDEAFALAIQPNGKIVVVGTSLASGDSDFAIFRFNANGSLDTSFNGTGKVATNIASGSYETARGVIIQADGKILVTGESEDQWGQADFVLVRYNADGSR